MEVRLDGVVIMEMSEETKPFLRNRNGSLRLAIHLPLPKRRSRAGSTETPDERETGRYKKRTVWLKYTSEVVYT